MEKVCTRCRKTKPTSDFYTSTSTNDGLQVRCKRCNAAERRRWYNQNKDHQRDVTLRRKYGISLDDFKAMLAEQGGCAICRRPEPGTRSWMVDHDHETGTVRSILCTNCNTGLGMFTDDPDLLDLAASYLRAHKLGLCSSAP